MLGVSDAHFLFLLDCCFASSAVFSAKGEVLAASAIDRVTPSSGQQESFSRVLASTLLALNGRPITVAQLHGKLMRDYYDGDLKTTPVHTELSDDLARSGSIVLAPLQDAPAPPPRNKRENPWPATANEPKILIAVTLSDTEQVPDVTQWKRGLMRDLPSGIEDIDITLTGFYTGQSALLVVKVPIAVWSALVSRPGYRFLGMTRSDNLVTDPKI